MQLNPLHAHEIRILALYRIIPADNSRDSNTTKRPKGKTMSRETMKWLNTMTLIGFTEKRGKAWHYKAEEQGDEPNHYVGAVPIEDVQRRLFSWHAVEGTSETTILLPDGVVHMTDPTSKFICRPPGAFGDNDPGAMLKNFKQGYLMHQYDEWLLQQVAAILDDSLNIGSAGMLADGGQAWVSVEVPDNIVTPSGVVFRPNLLAATSLDGSLSTTYKRVVTNVVCDNTMAAGLTEEGQQIKIRHSKYSNAKLTDVRAALEIVHTIGDDFSRQIEQLTNTAVTDDVWAAFLDAEKTTALVDDKGNEKTGRGLTMANNKRAKLSQLYNHDDRVAPWRGTAWGVVQAVNTFAHHVQGEKTGADRAQLNMSRAITGETDKLDRSTLAQLMGVLAPA